MKTPDCLKPFFLPVPRENHVFVTLFNNNNNNTFYLQALLQMLKDTLQF